MFLSVPVIAVIKLVLTDYIEYKNRLKDRQEKYKKRQELIERQQDKEKQENTEINESK